MGYLDDFLSYGKKAAEVGLGALEQLNRPAAAVTETVAEAGKAIGRTAGALTSFLSEGERPQLGEAFTPAEKIQEELKRGETMGVTEALTGLAKTAVAPVTGFIKNKSVPEILAEKQGAQTDTVTEATKANIAAAQEAKTNPAALAQLKKEGGLPVNAQETWSEFLKKPETRAMVAVPAVTLDPLLYGAGIGAKTAKGIEAAKTTEGMAPTLLGQLAEGERTAIKLPTVPGKTVPAIQEGIDYIQKGIDTVSQAAAGKYKQGLDYLSTQSGWVEDAISAIDATRKALFNRSANKEYNQIQELLINNAKTRANTAEEFLKNIEDGTNRSSLSAEGALNRTATQAENLGIGQAVMPLAESLYMKVAKKNPDLKAMYNIQDYDDPSKYISELFDVHNPTAADIVNRPMPSLTTIMKNKNYIMSLPVEEADKAAKISDDTFNMLKAKGFIYDDLTKNDFYSKPGDKVWTDAGVEGWLGKTYKELVDKWENIVANSSARSGEEFGKGNESLKYIMDNVKDGNIAPINPSEVSPQVIQCAKILPGWSEIKKFFDADSLNDISRGKFLSNLITPEAAERARKLKMNIMTMTNNLLDDIAENISYSGESGIATIGDLNEAIARTDAFKELTNNGVIKVFSNDPVKVLTSYGLGLGANKWRDNIYSWIVNKTGEKGSDMFRKIKAGEDAPEGYVSLWREKLPDYAVKEDLYAPLSDTLGKIAGTPKPETVIQDAYNKYMQLWKKSVLTGLFGEGYGYAVRNITSEALKTAQSGINTVPEMAKTWLGQIGVIGDKLTEQFPGMRKYLKPLDYFKQLGGASESVIGGSPWMVKLPNGKEVDAYKLAQEYSVVDSGFFAEEVFKGGKISDKVKIKLIKATDTNKAIKEFQDALKVQEPIWEQAGLKDWRLSNAKEDIAREIANKYGVPELDVLNAKPLPEYLVPVADSKGLVGYLESSDALGAGALANNAEKTARLTTFGKALQDGYTPEAAARLVGETSFNYADISDEARTMKTMIPFLTFYLKNIPFQLGKFISEPKVQRYLQHGMEIALPSKEELAKMPDYEKERLPLNTNVPLVGGTGMRQYLAQFQGLGLAQELKEGKLGKAVEEGLKDVVSAVNPLMRLAIELGTGTTVPGSRTTPLGATGGNILGMDRPIERYSGEKGTLLGVIPVPKKVEYAAETLVPPAGKLGKLVEAGLTKGTEGTGKQLLRYTTGIGAAEPKTAKEIRRAERSDKIAIQQDIRKSRLLLRRYKKDLKDNKITQQQFDSHKESLKNLEVELKKAYRTKKPVTIQEGSPVSDMLKETDKMKTPAEQSETSVSPLLNFFEQPEERQSVIKPSVMQEFMAPEIEKVKSPIDEFINSGYNNTGDDNMSKDVATKAINFALRNEDDSYDKHAKLENLGDGAGNTFIGLTDKYDGKYLQNTFGLSVTDLADLYKEDKQRALDIVKQSYYDLYWNKYFDQISDERLAIRLFDLMLNRGAGGLRSILSNAGYKLENLNQAIEATGKDTVYNNVVASAEELYRGLKQFNKFGNGWLNRLKRSEYTV